MISSMQSLMTVNRERETQSHARAGWKVMIDGNGRRRRRRLHAGAAVIAMVCGISAVAAIPARAGTGTGTQFSDGSFETPVVTPGIFQDLGQGQSIGPWTVTAGLVDLIGAGYWQAADGVQSVDLNGQTASIPGEPGAVSQTFPTTPLFAYEVSFALAGNPLSQDSPLAGPLTKTGEVLVNGQIVKKFSFNVTGKSPADMGYVTEEFTFLATGTSTTLEFASTNPGEGGPVIDNVSVESCLLVVCLN
jgi:choice-of-anchor C domain-containing protein